MIIILTILSLGLLIAFFLWFRKTLSIHAVDDDHEGLLTAQAICITSSIILLGVCIGVMINLFNTIPKANIIDDKIIMYEEENKNIEASISQIVEKYEGHEKEIFNDTKNESFITFATKLYPDLKSDKLVKTQIETYIKNNNKIKKLKEQKLNYSIDLWWLYFGS